MPNMKAGIHTVAKTLLNENKIIVFKRWATIQLYAQTSFHGQLKLIVNNKSDHFSSFTNEFRKILFRSDVDLPRQAENGSVEQFRHYM